MHTTNDVYVISLDAVDLNLLPIPQTHRDGGAVPLWCKSNLDSRRKDYYEFVIKSDAKDQNEPVIENVACHMCDINVPEVYLNEHKNGFRHKFNRKVADTALKRLQLYVNKEDINEFNEKLPSKHFCTECSIVIDSEEETSHKQTTGHRNALFLERFLNEFLNFYTNDDSKIDDTKKDIKTEVIKEINNSEQDFVSDEPNIIKTVLTNIKNEIIGTEDVEKMKDDENSKKNSDSDERNVNSSPSCDLQKDEVTFQIADGSKVNTFKVTGSYYEAIVEISPTSGFCMICNHMYIQENRSLHLCSEIHNQNSHERPLDKNCVRKINSVHHHCALCNDYFTEYDLHVYSKKHLTNFQNKIILHECDKTIQDNDNCNKDKKDENSRKYSDILKCDETGSSTGSNKNTAPVNKDTSDSLATNTSLSVPVHPTVFCDTCNIWISMNQFKKHKDTMKHTVNEMSDYHYLMKYLDKEILFCRICKVNVSNAMDDITEHFTSANHVKKYNKLLDAHNIIKIYKKYYCRECKVYILHKNEYLHIKSKEHADKVSFSAKGKIDEQCDNITGLVDKDVTETVDLVDSNTVGDGSSTATDNVQVNVNNDTALETVTQLDNNPLENKYICNKTAQDNDNCNKDKKYDNSTKYSDVLKGDENKSSTGTNNNTPVNKDTSDSLATNTNLSVPIHPTVFCDTCHIWISMNQFKKHKDTMKHTVDEMSDYHYLMKSLDKENLFCRICKVNVSNAMDDITEHFTSARHVKIYNKLLSAHNIIKIYKKYYCRECKVYILHKNEYLHIKSKEHADKVGFSAKGKIDEQCDNITGLVDKDVTETVDLVDSNTVGDDSSTATDNVQVNVNNDTALETVTQLDNNPLENRYIICDKTAQDNDNCNKDNDNCNKDMKDDNTTKYSDVLKSDGNRSSTGTNKNTASSNKDTSDSLATNNSLSVPIHPTVFCDTCNIWISMNQFKKHKNTTKHNFSEMSDYHYLLKCLDEENLFCRICKVNISNVIDDITEHFTSAHHVKKYNKLLDAHNIIKIYKKYYCRKCKVYMLHKNEYLHIKSKEHADKVGFSAKGKIDEQCDNITGFVDKDVTEAVDLVDSNTVGDGSSTATDNVQFNVNNGTALETVTQLDNNPLKNRYICDKTAQDNDNCNKDKKYDKSTKYSDVLKGDENKSSTGTNNNTPVNKDTPVNSDRLATNTNLSVPIHPTVFCDTCNIWISMNQFKKHKNTMKHNFNEMSDYHYLLKCLDEENLFCRICKVNISNVIDDITEHFTSAHHVKKYNKLLDAHNIIKIYKKYYCRECKVYILHKNEYLHIKSKEHADKVGFSAKGKFDEQCDNITGLVDKDVTETVDLVDSNTVGDDSSTATDNVQVNVNNDTALETVTQLDNNPLENRYIYYDKTAQDNDNCNKDKKYDNSTKYSDVLKSDENKTSAGTNYNNTPVNKDTCDSLATNTNLNVPIHPTVFCDTCNVRISSKQFKKHKNTTKHTVNKMSDYHYLMKYLDKENLFCRICKVNVSNVMDDITEHFTGALHVKMYNKLLNAHSIIKRYKKYYCRECKVYMLHKNEYLHIKSKEHTDKVGFSETDEIVEQCDNIQVNTNNDTDLETVNQQDLVKISQALMEIQSSLAKFPWPEWLNDTHPTENVITALDNENTVENRYICDVCKVEVPNNDYNIAEHNRGRSHMLNFETYVPRY